MRIKRITCSPVHIEDFADKHGLTMVVVERGQNKRWLKWMTMRNLDDALKHH